jgi:hypothetical protein
VRELAPDCSLLEGAEDDLRFVTYDVGSAIGLPFPPIMPIGLCSPDTPEGKRIPEIPMAIAKRLQRVQYSPQN